MVRRDGDEQAACCLRIKENCSELFGNSLFVVDHAFGKIAVVFQAAGNTAGAYAIQSTLEQRDLVDAEAERDLRRESHFASVADQTEAGDVGEGVDGALVVGCWPGRWPLARRCRALLGLRG